MHPVIITPMDLAAFLGGILLCIFFGLALLVISTFLLVFVFFFAKTALWNMFGGKKEATKT